MTDPKHISQLGKMQQARANQDMQDALLSIVAQQGKAVRIPLAIAQGVASTHRMVLVRDTDENGDEFIELSVEKADVVITEQKTKLIQ